MDISTLTVFENYNKTVRYSSYAFLKNSFVRLHTSIIVSSDGKCLLSISTVVTDPAKISLALRNTLLAGKNMSFSDAIMRSGDVNDISSFFLYSLGGLISIL